MITTKLTEILLIKELIESGTTTGEIIKVYKPSYRLYASINNRRGDMDFQEVHGDLYEDSISFYVRYKKFDPKRIRIEYNCRDYKIENITNISKEFTIIDCVMIR